MSAFPHPSLGPSQPATVRRRRASTTSLAAAITSVVLVVVLVLEPGRKILEGSFAPARTLILGLGFALLAGGTILLMGARYRARCTDPDG